MQCTMGPGSKDSVIKTQKKMYLVEGMVAFIDPNKTISVYLEKVS